MSSELKAQLTASMKDAMKAKEKERLVVIRSMLAAVKQVEIDNQVELDDAGVLAVLDKAMKQRRDAQQQYMDADRPDLAEQEAYEMTVIQDFMPQALTEDEISQLIDEAVAETGASSMQDMGKVMAQLKPQMQGRADMGAVSKLIKAKLG
ncbi:GatB/YqeY domain-containing protein [Thiomicrorhabdus sp. ZW0627]|uniref:GatB/YqeY domain-containing protein n=1 Tax=Thiomicrorhabdus sp. ZW0627 TaxID=3039774 RepID=UPI002436DA20|nr:GatB/YqeY domain-containing protein [Thiomicrorhabdus sp. ZW0627]MDG6773752.1 GatB/YqeY domain-containing protein [Thiomicrorhabdus sp. ZW0627]